MTDDAVAVRLRAALAERSLVAETCAGSHRRVQARRHQAALPRLGRSHRLLLAVGDAGRPLRLRRSRREPRGLAGERRAMRRPADHQSSAGLQGRLSRSRPRLYSARRARRKRRRASKRSARARASPALLDCLHGLPRAPNGCSGESDGFAAAINDLRLASKSRSSTRWRIG